MYMYTNNIKLSCKLNHFLKVENYFSCICSYIQYMYMYMYINKINLSCKLNHFFKVENYFSCNSYLITLKHIIRDCLVLLPGGIITF